MTAKTTDVPVPHRNGRGGRALTWPEPWRRLAAAAGGVDALASNLSTSRRHLQRWALGHNEPSGLARLALGVVCQKLSVKCPIASDRFKGTEAERPRAKRAVKTSAARRTARRAKAPQKRAARAKTPSKRPVKRKPKRKPSAP